MHKPSKSFSPEQHQEYEKLKFAARLHTDSVKKWAATLVEIKAKEYYLIDSASWDEWLIRHCPWTKDTVQIALKEEVAKRLIAETTGEPIINRSHSRAHDESAASRARPIISNDGKVSIPKHQVAEREVLDVTGYPIHPTILPLWHRNAELTPLLAEISRVKGAILEARDQEDDLFMGIDQDAITKLSSAYSLISAARLDYVCGFCQGKCKLLEQDCPSCHSTGLMTKYQWDTGVTTQVKEMRRKNSRHATT